MAGLSIIFIFFLVIICFLMQRITKCFAIISIPGVTFIFLLVYHGFYIPFLLLQNCFEDVHPIYIDNILRYRLFFSLTLMYTFLVCGIAIAKYMLNFRSKEIIQYAQEPIKCDKKIYPIIIICLFALSIFAFYYFAKTETFSSLIEYFLSFGDTTKIKLLRQSMNPEHFGLSGYIFGWSLWVFYPLLSLIFIGISLQTKKISFIILALFCVTINAILALSLKSKGPFVHFLTSVLFFRFFIYKGRFLILKNKAILLYTITIIFLVSSLFYFMIAPSFLVAMKGVLLRAIKWPNYALLLHFKYFPDTCQFLGGRDIGLLCRIMGWEYISSPALLSQLAFGKEGNANALFISGLWVNFGYWGIVIGSFLLGMYLEWIQVWLVRGSKTVTRVALFSYLSIQVWILASISIFPALFAFGIGTAPIFVRIIELFGDIFPVRSRKKLLM